MPPARLSMKGCAAAHWFEDGSDVDLVGLGELRVVRGNIQGIEGHSCCIYKYEEKNI